MLNFSAISFEINLNFVNGVNWNEMSRSETV